MSWMGDSDPSHDARPAENFQVPSALRIRRMTRPACSAREPGSTGEALVKVTGRLRPTARVLAQTYAAAIDGVPTWMRFDTATTAFVLRYRVPRRLARRKDPPAPTLVVVPTAVRYRHGYCVKVTGGRVLSPTDSALLEIDSGRGARSVTVVVTRARAAKIVHGRRMPICPGAGGAS